MNYLSTLSSALAFAVATAMVFRFAEQGLQDDFRARITSWLDTSLLHGSDWVFPNGGVLAQGLFDAVFGRQHFAIRCLLRTCLASLSAILVMTIVAVSASPPTSEYYVSIGTMAVTMGAAATLNFLPDYVSLLQTRVILGWMSRAESRLGILSWLLLDILLTTAIAALTLAIMYYFLWGDLESAAEFSTAATTLLLESDPRPTALVGIYFYSTYLTSCFVVLAAALAFWAPTAQWCIRLLSNVGMSFDTDKPLTALGTIAGAALFVLYLMVALAREQFL